MPITEFDRCRIHEDIEQQEELIARSQAIADGTDDQDKKDAMAADIAAATAEIATLKAQL